MADADGVVVALDAAGYGPVTIAKSVTITTNSGFYAGIAASSGNAVTISGDFVRVVLRGLALNGLGASRGIHLTGGQASFLAVENCVISNFSQSGIEMISTSTFGYLTVVDTVIRGNGGSDGDGILVAGGQAALDNVKLSHNGRSGLTVQSSDAAYPTVHVVNSDSSFNKYGYYALQTQLGEAMLSIRRSSASKNSTAGVAVNGYKSKAAVAYSHIAGNEVGLLREGEDGLLETLGNNILRQNGVDTIGVTLKAGT